MTWSTPKTWVSGDVLTAADLNTYVRDNTNDLDSRLTTLDSSVDALGTVPLLVGSNTSESTTTTTGSYAEIVTISGLSIAATSGIIVKFSFRKTTGAAASASIGVKINPSSSGQWISGGSGVATDAANAAGNGYAILDIPPYLATTYDDAAHGGSSFMNTASTETNAYFKQSAARPNATITSVVILGQVSSASITLGIQGVRVYSFPA